MTPYLVTATDRAGRRDTFAREAASIEHLRRALELDGFSDIELLDNELTARLRQQQPLEGRPRNQADYRFEARQRFGPDRRGMWALALRNHRGWLVAIALLVAYGVWARNPWLAAGGGALLAFGVYTLHIQFGRAERYNTLLRAWARGQWDEAERLIAELRADPMFAGNAALHSDLSFRLACLHGLRGQVPFALVLVEPMRSEAFLGKGLFEARTSSIHYLAGDYAAFLDGATRACEASGNERMYRLDLAFTHARFGDAARARELLATVERDCLTAMEAPLVEAVEGVVLAREGEHAGAAREFAASTQRMAAFAGNPAIWPMLGILLGYQALATARTGDTAGARALVAEWREVVDAWLDIPTRNDLLACIGS